VIRWCQRERWQLFFNAFLHALARGYGASINRIQFNLAMLAFLNAVPQPSPEHASAKGSRPTGAVLACRSGLHILGHQPDM
jgi:hypothetical protein